MRLCFYHAIYTKEIFLLVVPLDTALRRSFSVSFCGSHAFTLVHVFQWRGTCTSTFLNENSVFITWCKLLCYKGEISNRCPATKQQRNLSQLRCDLQSIINCAYIKVFFLLSTEYLKLERNTHQLAFLNILICMCFLWQISIATEHCKSVFIHYQDVTYLILRMKFWHQRSINSVLVIKCTKMDCRAQT